MAINSYHLAILEATDDGQFMDLADNWRTYHLLSDICDCEYSFDCDSDLEVSVNEAAKHEPLNEQKPSVPKLYVPVTRKVSPRTWKNSSNPECKVSLTDETVGLPEDHVYF